MESALAEWTWWSQERQNLAGEYGGPVSAKIAGYHKQNFESWNRIETGVEVENRKGQGEAR